ncbi:MAG: hypothetical protein WBU20_09895 [Candidatus Acidiferrum sp.]
MKPKCLPPRPEEEHSELLNGWLKPEAPKADISGEERRAGKNQNYKLG